MAEQKNQERAVSNELLDSRLSRRSMMRVGAGVVGAGVLTGLLAACGGGGGDSDGATTATEAPDSGQSTNGGGESTVTPAGSDSEASGDATPGGTLRLALAGEPDSADPQYLLTPEAFRVAEQMYNALVSVDDSLNIIPDIAESWDVDDDATHFQFKLRKDVVFHHGRELTAEDIEYTAQRLADGSPYEYIFRDLDSITVVDPHTIEFTFSRSAAHFLAAMAPRWTGIVAKEKVEEGGASGLKMLDGGTGPFKLVEWHPLQQVVLERNPDYFEQPYPYLDQIIWTPVQDETSRVNQVMSGTMDLDIDGPAKLFDTYKSNPEIDVLEGPVVSFVFAGLNTARPPFDNVKARQALAWAVDRQQIIDLAANGRGVPLLGGPIGPEEHWCYNDEVYYPEPDLDKAGNLLREAGVAAGTEISLVVAAGTTFANIAQVLQQQLEPLGLVVKIEALEGGAANTRVFQQRDFDMMVWRWGTMIDPHDFTGEFFYSTGSYNFPGLEDPKLDQLLDEGVGTPDLDERRRIYADVEEYLAVETVPYLFLYRPTVYAAYHKTLQGLKHEAAATRLSLQQVSFTS